MKVLRCTAGVVFLVMAMAPAASGEPARVAGDALKAAVAGKTVYLDTPIGALPINYRQNGTMSGYSKALGVYAGTDRDNGRWWVQRDQLCQRWSTWLDAATHCYNMRISGRTVHWSRDDGRSGTATIAN